MTNEEFQRIVLEKLGGLEEGQKRLEEGQKQLEERQKQLEEGQKQIKEELEAVREQTAHLTEFREEVKNEIASMKITISRIEVATADNWGDIARIKSVIQHSVA